MAKDKKIVGIGVISDFLPLDCSWLPQLMVGPVFPASAGLWHDWSTWPPVVKEGLIYPASDGLGQDEPIEPLGNSAAALKQSQICQISIRQKSCIPDFGHIL